ncbi:MAG: glycosyltransferase family 2 protein [Lentisphaerae bacterium]|nr:glycosyltransferase family 2 protein [Lentisphaerota bacterium]
MKTPLISVALTSYNGEKFIAAQLDSLLHQSMPVDEIIVCDDNSTDRTPEILNDYQRRYPDVVKIFRNDCNLGCYRNFENALSHCGGKYIFLCDQDDVWLPEKVAKLLQILLDEPECDGVFCDSAAVGEQLQELDFSFWQMRKFGKKAQRQCRDNALKIMLKRIPVAAHSVALRQRALQYVLPFPEISGFYPDSWIALQVALRSQWALTPEKLTCYRVHSGNITAPQLATAAVELRRSQAVRAKNGIAQTARLGEVLLDRIAPETPDFRRKMVQDFTTHYTKRAKYSGNFLLRSIQIAGEVCSGRYFKYSNGVKSIAADLLLH